MPRKTTAALVPLLLAVLGGSLAPPLAAPVSAQESVTTASAATLYRRPDTTSEVRATVPAGTVLEVLDRQPGWVAVNTAQGVIGWIQESLATPVAPAASPAPAPAPAPSPASGAAPAPAPPAARPGGATPPPPPPPARPPSAGGAAPSDQAVSGEIQQGGLFDSGGWARLAFSATEGSHPGGELVAAKMLTRIVEFRTEIYGTRRVEGALPGIEKAGGPESAPGNYATDEDPVWDFGLQGALNFYLLQPRGDVPFGIHLGGFGDWTRYLGSITPSVGSFSTIGYGGELGGFYRGRTGTVVRVAVQLGQVQYRSDDPAVTEGLTNVLVGVEPRLGGVQLGAYGGIKNDQNFVKVGIVFR